MNIDIQYKIKSNPNLQKYLKENSYWYKYLNRNPISLKYMEEQMRRDYKLTSKDRLNKFASSLDMITKFMDILK